MRFLKSLGLLCVLLSSVFPLFSEYEFKKSQAPVRWFVGETLSYHDNTLHAINTFGFHIQPKLGVGFSLATYLGRFYWDTKLDYNEYTSLVGLSLDISYNYNNLFTGISGHGYRSQIVDLTFAEFYFTVHVGYLLIDHIAIILNGLGYGYASIINIPGIEAESGFTKNVMLSIKYYF